MPGFGFNRGRLAGVSAAARPRPGSCFHCALPLPAPVPAWLDYAGAMRPMCCASCLAAARLIIDSGQGAYYAARLAAASAGAAGA